jgi:hypothetical protein
MAIRFPGTKIEGLPAAAESADRNLLVIIGDLRKLNK